MARRIGGLALSTFLLGLLGACGGGAGGGPGAVVAGKLTSRDGSTDSLAGVRVEVVGGESYAVTGPDGTFTLDVEPGDVVVLDFDDPEHEEFDEDGQEEGEDGSESEDEFEECDIEGDQVDVAPLEDGEVCDLEVDMKDGDVCEARVDREGHEEGEERHREGDSRLLPPDGSPEPESVGEAELECGVECCELGIWVGEFFLTQPTVLDVVVLQCEGDAEVVLGQMEVNGEGRGHFEMRACVGEELPFGVEHLAGIAGYCLELRAADGTVVLAGKVPALHEDEEEEHDEDGEGEDGEGEDEPR